MKKYIQHGSVTTYEHCEKVAEVSHKIDQMLSLHCNQNTLLTGAMLHDFYLPTMSSPRVLFYKALRQLTISLYLSKQS
jgi:HD superfamily phosphodiesterase